MAGGLAARREANPRRPRMRREIDEAADAASLHRAQQLQELAGVRRNHDRMAVEHEVLTVAAGRQVDAVHALDRDGHAPCVTLAIRRGRRVGEPDDGGIRARLGEQPDAMRLRQRGADRELGGHARRVAPLIESFDRARGMALSARVLEERDELGHHRRLVWRDRLFGKTARHRRHVSPLRLSFCRPRPDRRPCRRIPRVW